MDLNFLLQVAAGTLDASTKIYAYRVDSVYGDTLKIAGGLGQAGKQDQGEAGAGEDGEEVGEDGDGNSDQPKKKRRTKKSATVEKNLKNINVNKFELEFDVDPLFKKTSSQFDSGSGGNQFLATLQVRSSFFSFFIPQLRPIYFLGMTHVNCFWILKKS